MSTIILKNERGEEHAQTVLGLWFCQRPFQSLPQHSKHYLLQVVHPALLLGVLFGQEMIKPHCILLSLPVITYTEIKAPESFRKTEQR